MSRPIDEGLCVSDPIFLSQKKKEKKKKIPQWDLSSFPLSVFLIVQRRLHQWDLRYSGFRGLLLCTIGYSYIIYGQELWFPYNTQWWILEKRPLDDVFTSFYVTLYCSTFVCRLKIFGLSSLLLDSTLLNWLRGIHDNVETSTWKDLKNDLINFLSQCFVCFFIFVWVIYRICR